MTLELIAGAPDMLPRSFLPWSTELLFNTDPLQLTSALLLTGGAVGTRHCSPPYPVRFTSCTQHYAPRLYSPCPSHNLLLLTKEGCRDAKKWCSYLIPLVLFFFCFFSPSTGNLTCVSGHQFCHDQRETCCSIT